MRSSTPKLQLGDTVEFTLRPAGGRARGDLSVWLGGDYWEIVTPLGLVHRRYGREVTRVSDDVELPTVNHEPDEREI